MVRNRPKRVSAEFNYPIKPVRVSDEEWQEWFHIFVPISPICVYNKTIDRCYLISSVAKKVRAEKTGRIRFGSPRRRNGYDSAIYGSIISFEKHGDAIMFMLKWT